MASESFENLRVYKAAEALSDTVWSIVSDWDRFPKETIGKQLVRAADSVGANIAEGAGRGSYLDNQRFVKIARGSLNETRHFLRRSQKRKLLTEQQVDELRKTIQNLSPMLNAYLRAIGPVKGRANDK